MMQYLKKYRSVFLALIVALGLISWLYDNAPEPEQSTQQNLAPRVPYTEVIESSQAIPIYSRGRVSASEVRQITNQVPGLVKRVSKELSIGARVKQGDILIELEQQPFVLDIAQKQAELDRTKLELVRIKAKAAVAQKGLKRNATDYARHIPQVRHASSQVSAAEAALAYAKQQLKKTVIRAPIDGKVIKLSITEGEYILATSNVATIYGTDEVEVRLPLNDQQIEILGLNHKGYLGKTSKPIASLNSYQNPTKQWQGLIDRIEGERDRNQLLYVIAQVSSNNASNKSSKSLLPGSFVEARIEGQVINNLKLIPRSAEPANNTVWTIDNDMRLHRKNIELVYRGKELSFVKAGLNANERIVTGSFHLMAEGMKVEPYLANDLALIEHPVASTIQ